MRNVCFFLNRIHFIPNTFRIKERKMSYEMCLLKRIDNHRDHNKIRDLQFCFQLF